jgi:hypothetical protein
VEQRRGSSSQPLKAVPVKGAGFDPAFIPGLTAPAGEQPEDARPDEAGPDGKAEAAAAAPAGAGASGEAPGAAGTAEPEDTDAAVAAGGPGGTDEPDATAAVDDGDADDDAEPAADGPVFEAADRRARIVADRRGVRLALDDQGCEFRWDEIGAVETETARFGKRFTVTVHTPDSRWYPIEIEAKARSDFKQWDEQLDAVLDAYFEAE